MPLSMESWKIKRRGLQMELSQIFNMRMLIISWPWDLFGSSLLIIFSIFSSVRVIEDSDLLVYRCTLVGSLLPVSNNVHYFAKNELKSSAFSLKLVTYLFSCKIGGMHGIFLFVRKPFKMLQYALTLVCGSVNFLDSWISYFRLDFSSSILSWRWRDWCFFCWLTDFLEFVEAILVCNMQLLWLVHD